MPASNALFTARALVDELVRGGVRTFCVAPGSRSTSLALAIAERRDVTAHVLTDERSMGFFALGMARVTAAATAVVCTSGTAVANLLPAVIESALGGGALVLLTADRPPEMRDCASPQTIDQVGIFGSHARWAADVPILNAGMDAARVLRSLASRAAAMAIAGDGGPVHLNVALREPFVDDSFPLREPFADGGREGGRPFTETIGRASVCAAQAASLAERLGCAKRGVIVCAGAEVPAEPVALLAKALGWPILADPLSGMRFGNHDRSHVVAAIEPLMRSEELRRQLRPDAIVRFGLTPPPRSLQRWLDEAWPTVHVVVAGGAWPDPTRSATTVVRSDARDFCLALASACGSPSADVLAWRDLWIAVSSASRIAIDAALDSDTNAPPSVAIDARLDPGLDASNDLFDGIVLREVAAALPDGSTLFVGNSMPVRDAEAFLAAGDKPLRVMANRGASGIDGVLSTALGVAAASRANALTHASDVAPEDSATRPPNANGSLLAASALDATSGQPYAETSRRPHLVPSHGDAPAAAPTALVLGDLSFLHDAGALAFAARQRIPLLVVVVNNDGGGIFSYLPLRDALHAADQSATFERFFGTPHGTDLERVASVTGGFFRRITTRAELPAAIRDALAASANGPAVLEVVTDRESARLAQQRVVHDAQAAVAHLLSASRRSA